jgi:hypothetical protein
MVARAVSAVGPRSKRRPDPLHDGNNMLGGGNPAAVAARRASAPACVVASSVNCDVTEGSTSAVRRLYPHLGPSVSSLAAIRSHAEQRCGPAVASGACPLLGAGVLCPRRCGYDQDLGSLGLGRGNLSRVRSSRRDRAESRGPATAWMAPRLWPRMIGPAHPLLLHRARPPLASRS